VGHDIGVLPHRRSRLGAASHQLPNHRQAALATLQCAGEREAVAAAVARWPADALETALADAGGCGVAVRSVAEWQAHPQAVAIAALPVLETRRIGDSEPEALPPADRPLSGVRVLDLTRVIAGPVCGRTLAAQGATVMRVDGPRLGDTLPFIIDTGLGKLSALIDLRTATGMQQILSLIRGADVFVQAYRPGALAALGLSPGRLAALRPGLIQVQLSAYGRLGPWAQRRGFDSLVQSCSGIASEEGAAFGGDGPKHLPAQVLDHATGHLAAFGALIALTRRAREGGSWLVEVSLAQTGRWLPGLGRLDATGCPDPGIADVADLLQSADSKFGRLAHVRPAARFSRTLSFWATPPVPIGTHPPAWP
jgi:crotonobetainyl-CoA:carnitine CoA-transferase CaiB-like acyl-CoA transferase